MAVTLRPVRVPSGWTLRRATGVDRTRWTLERWNGSEWHTLVLPHDASPSWVQGWADQITGRVED